MHPILLTNPPVNDQTLWFVVGVGGIIILYVLMRPRKKKDAPDPAPKFSLARQRGVEHQMNHLLVELSEMSRQITAQLDTRAVRLELLIKEADEKLAMLRAAVDGKIPAEQDVMPTQLPIVSVAPEVIDSAPIVSDAPAPVAASAQRHAEVYTLADDGRSANEIARALNRSMGEIELILALRSR